MLLEPKCSQRRCKWFLGVIQDEDGELSERPNCQAFPNGIPVEIAYGDNQHAAVEPGQKGDFIFEEE